MYDDTTHRIHARRDLNQRAGDADRDATSERLRHHHVDGRLDAEEFQERIDRCYQAKTIGELEQLVSDLPPEPISEGRRQLRRLRMIPLVPIVIAIVAVSALTGGHHGHVGFWVVIPLFFLLRFSHRRRGPWGMGRIDAVRDRT
ncbi:MAG: DUF1707 domain-containing protein [Solirubrobacteraceae bacterium]|jgi:hypothetical protein